MLAIVLAIVAIGIWMEGQKKLAEYGVLFIILCSTVLSAFSIIPRSASVYSFIVSYLVPMSLPMLLFKANLVEIWRESGRVILAFCLAATATGFCSVLGLMMFDLGPRESEIGGAMSAGFIGGAVNTAAVADAYGITDDPIMGIALAAGYLVVIPFLAFIVMFPTMKRLWKLFSPNSLDTNQTNETNQEAVDEASPTAFSICASICIAFLIVAVSDWLAGLSGFAPMKYLAITVLSVGFATCLPRQASRLHGHYDLGRIAIYCFFVVIGAGINFSLAMETGFVFAAFSAIVMFGHLILLAILGRIFKLTGAELIIASNACVLGPPTAAAMALSRGWYALVTPALLVGVLGYVLGTFFGILIGSLL